MLAESITGRVERARASRSSYSLEEFVNTDKRKDDGGMCWFYPMEDYARCFRAVGVKDRGELDSLCKRRYTETDVCDAVDELLQSEENAADLYPNWTER